MKSNEFNSLSLEMKAEHVSDYGNYIGFRECNNSLSELFSLYDLLVEVWYINKEKTEVERIELLQSDETLDSYIDNMKKIKDEKIRYTEQIKKHYAFLSMQIEMFKDDWD